MSEYRNKIALGVALSVIVGSVFIGSLYYLPQGTNTTTSTISTTTSVVLNNYPASATTANSSLGLQLDAYVNSTSIQYGQAVQVTVEIFNQLTRTNNVTGASDWKLNSLVNSTTWVQGLVCFTPANFVVFQGYYDSGNLSTARSPLQLYSPLIIAPICLNSNFTAYLFQPYSSVANVSLTSPPNYNYSINMQSSSPILSYCNKPPSAEGLCLAGFTPGTYTIVAGDEWGQLVVLHFVVSAVGSSTSSSIISTVSTSIGSCSTNYSNGTMNGLSLYLATATGSTANLCVRYFYYNTTATATINTLDQLTIFAPVLSNGTLKNVNSSFSISASVSQVQIGGPQLENEGTLVTYTVKSTNASSSGTYEIALSSGLYPQDVICAYGIYLSLQVGNTTNPVVVSSCHALPTPQDNPGLIYSEIVGATNSTQ